ncbi:PGF-pre-PGF domain-containing protein [Methanococcoides sp. FTZ1]|uniref:PGF-pre-PGF domain-containing protein n=1 Tax=Methanococcoides sp. FTZ1 TaxID=3439061 RepID=UPI003F849B18
MKRDILISGKSRVCSLLLFFLVTITCISGLAGATTNISIMPASGSVQEMQEFTLTVYLQPDRPVAGIQFDLIYDSDLINVVTVSEGDFLGQDGALVWFNPGNVESSNGKIDSIYGLILDRTTVEGPGSVSVIQMRAGNVSGTSALYLSNVVISDAQGQVIPTEIVNGSITVSSDTSSSGSSESSDGSDEAGSSAITTTSGSSETFEAIERGRQAVYLGSQVSFQFDKPENPVRYINYESLANAGNVIVTIEVLNNPSRFVSSAPPGTAYKNVNIWLGKPGYATEDNIKDAVIGFRVDNSWFEENRISDSSVMLYRYEQDRWVPLPTTKISETSSYVNFESTTTEFSPFVIVGDISEEVIAEVAEADESAEEGESLDQNAALILCLSLLALLFARRR